VRLRCWVTVAPLFLNVPLSFETSGKANPATQCQIPGDMHPERLASQEKIIRLVAWLVMASKFFPGIYIIYPPLSVKNRPAEPPLASNPSVGNGMKPSEPQRPSATVTDGGSALRKLSGS
jgi:hypothetical protein